MRIRLLATMTAAGTIALSTLAFANGTTPHSPPPPSNGSSDRGGTQYHPVYDNGHGSSVGVIVTPNPGTPQTPPSDSYGAGFRIPIPGS